MCIEVPLGTISKIIKVSYDNWFMCLLCKDFPSTFIVAQARCDYGFYFISPLNISY